jgi:hypothetical protein
MAEERQAGNTPGKIPGVMAERETKIARGPVQIYDG